MKGQSWRLERIQSSLESQPTKLTAECDLHSKEVRQDGILLDEEVRRLRSQMNLGLEEKRLESHNWSTVWDESQFVYWETHHTVGVRVVMRGHRPVSRGCGR